MSGRNIFDDFIDFHQRKHTEKLMKKIPELKEKELLSCLPDNLPVSVNNVIDVVNRKLDIPKEEVSNTIQRLIDNGKVATSTGFKTRTKYITKP